MRHALADAEFPGDPIHAHAGGAKLPGAGKLCHLPVYEDSRI
ncbi:MAG: hypothetical protein ACKVON_12450 [Beijerinckiaceae bacterium]